MTARRGRIQRHLGAWSVAALAGLVGSLGTGTRASASPRVGIIGGRPAPEASFGFIAAVLFNHADGKPDYLCSGTLVASNVVLTAGHCGADETTGVAERPGGFQIVTGAANWYDGANRVVSTVNKVIIDPSFRARTLVGDAALLVLSAPVSSPTVALWRGGRVGAGTHATMVGWGATQSAQQTYQTLLEYGPTVVQSTGYCTAPDDSEGHEFRPLSELCTADTPRDSAGTCEGDSGGPLLKRRSSGRSVELAITSIGPTDCNTYSADYFTAVAPLAGWIRREIATNPPSSG